MSDVLERAEEEFYALQHMSYTGDQPDLAPVDIKKIASLIKDLAAAVRAGGEAAAALRRIAEYEDSHGAGPPEDVMQEIAREALASLEPAEEKT